MKKLLVLLLFLIPALGICAEDQEYVINDFSGGLNQHISEYATPNNQAHDCLNVRFNDKFGALSKREPLLNATDYGNSAIIGLHRFYKSDGTERTIAAIGTQLKTDINGTATNISSGYTDGKRWQFVTFKDIAIGGNGYDLPIKWDGVISTAGNIDGSRATGEVCAELGSAFASLATGTDLNASSWYQYKMAWWDGSTYDYSSAKSNPIQTGGEVHSVNLTDIPIGPTGTICRYIYRTLGMSNQTTVESNTTYYLVYNLTGNTATTWTDNITDAEADDDDAPNWTTVLAGSNVTPPKGSLLEIQSERLFASGNPTYGSDLYWSDDGNPDHFLPSDFNTFRADDGDKITFIKPFLGILTVGKTNTIQKWYTEGNTTDWYASDVFSFVGCPAPYSVAVTPSGIGYLSRNGICLFTGQSSQLISDAVTQQIRDISQTNIVEAVGTYHNGEYRLAYTSDETGSAYNDRVLVYDFIRNAYTLDTENINCWVSYNSGNDFGTLYSGSSSTDGWVVAHSGSSTFLSKRYKSDISAGTFDDVRVIGTENDPVLELAWDCSIDGWLTELQTKNASIATLDSIGTYLPNATVDRPDTQGYWMSPTYIINATSLDKLYWNELLGANGDVAFQIRTASTTSDCLNATWSSEVSNPSGSDISTVTANATMQLRANLTTSDINYTPNLYESDNYIFKVTYSKVGSTYESSFLSKYQTGWKDFGVPGRQKLIKRIKVYCKGTEGLLNINFKNDVGDIDRTFVINLATGADENPDDEYTAQEEDKVYTYLSPINSETSPSAVGQLFMFTITENGIIDWDINKLEIEFQDMGTTE